MTYVRNAWYAAAWSEEVGPDTLFYRTYLEEPVLIYRLGDGTPVAMSNRCPHRFAPLHLGRRIGDAVECPYHGLVFGPDGRCVGNPHGDGIVPRAAQARSYPLFERHNVIWIWPGDLDTADASQIVDYSYMSDTTNWTTVNGYLHLKANYEILIDNLTDLSHAPIVHPILEHREVTTGKFKLVRDGDHAETLNWCPGFKPPAFFDLLPQTASLKDADGLVDHWQDMTYDPPGCMNTLYGVTRRGRPREEGLATLNPNLVTPESARTSHYFWAGVRNFGLNDPVLNAIFRKAYAEAFDREDRPMVEGVQAMMGDGGYAEGGDFKHLLLVNDGASVHARRVMARRRAEEALRSSAAVEQ